MRPAATGDECPRLPITHIDLAGVAEALGDNSGDTAWWYDPESGQTEMAVPDAYAIDGEDEEHPYERGLIPIEPTGSRDAYLDMVAFTDSISNPRASDLLVRALEGRGAFRRFRDTLHEFPDLRERWLVYSNAANGRRAIDWLLDERCVDPHDAEAEGAARAAIVAAVLAEIGSEDAGTFDETELVDRWVEIRDRIDQGRTATINRDGRPWATIARHPTAP